MLSLCAPFPLRALWRARCHSRGRSSYIVEGESLDGLWVELVVRCVFVCARVRAREVQLVNVCTFNFLPYQLVLGPVLSL
jgi:hypothetical protein